MYLLLAHDYAKFWKAENKAVEVKRFEFAGEENERLCRRYVLRSLLKKKIVEDAKPRFIMKRFRNIPSKVRQYMYPQETVKRNIAAEKMLAENKGKVEGKASKLSRTRDSTDVVKQKLKTVTADEQPMDYELANVSLCSEALECASDLEVVSHCSSSQDLTKLEIPHKLSHNVPVGHLHILCDGPSIKVKNLPHGGHRHTCKLLAKKRLNMVEKTGKE